MVEIPVFDQLTRCAVVLRRLAEINPVIQGELLRTAEIWEARAHGTVVAKPPPSSLVSGYDLSHPAQVFQSVQAGADEGAFLSTKSRTSMVSASPTRVGQETITHGKPSRVKQGPAALRSGDPAAIGVSAPGRASSQVARRAPGPNRFQGPTVVREGRHPNMAAPPSLQTPTQQVIDVPPEAG